MMLKDSTIYVDSKHGNANKKTGFYLSTLKSVVTEISSKSDIMTPKLVCDQLQESKSNEKFQNRMPVDRSRDRKQCEKVKYNDSNKKRKSATMSCTAQWSRQFKQIILLAIYNISRFVVTSRE